MNSFDYQLIAEAIKKTKEQVKSAVSDYALINFALNFSTAVKRNDFNFKTDDFLDRCSMNGCDN